MRKKILLLVVAVAVIFGGVIGFAAYNASSLVAKFKPQIEQAASDALGATVRLGAISVRVFPTLNLVVDAVTIESVKAGEEASQGAVPHSESLTLNNLTLNVALMPLLSRRLEVHTLQLNNPRITLIKEPEGTRLAGLPKPTIRGTPQTQGREASQRASQTSEVQRTPEQSGHGASPLPIAIELSGIVINEAVIMMEDRVAKSEKELATVSFSTGVKLDGNLLTVTDALLDGRALGGIPVSLRLPRATVEVDTLLTTLPALTVGVLRSEMVVEGELSASTLTGTLTVRSQGVTLSELPRALAPIVPELSAIRLEGALAPDLKINLKGPEAIEVNGTLGLRKVGVSKEALSISAVDGDLSISASLQEQKVSSKELGVTFNGAPLTISLEASAAPEAATLRSFELKGFSGVFSAEGRAGLSGAQPLAAKGKASALNLGQILRAVAGEERVSGTLDTLQFDITTALTEPMPKLQGSSLFRASNVTIEGFNLLGDVLNGVKDLPFLSGSLAKAVPQEERGTVQQNRTVLSSSEGSVSFGGNGLQLRSISASAPLFTLTASGQVGFTGELNLNASVAFSKSFSAALARSARELSRIYDDQERLVIPVAIRGRSGSVQVIPDVAALMKLGGRKAVEKEASRLLDRALGGGGAPSSGRERRGLGGALGF